MLTIILSNYQLNILKLINFENISMWLFDSLPTAGDGEIDPWWRVDFEGEHCIRTITIINRIYCCSEYSCFRSYVVSKPLLLHCFPLNTFNEKQNHCSFLDLQASV